MANGCDLFISNFVKGLMSAIEERPKMKYCMFIKHVSNNILVIYWGLSIGND